VQEKLQQQEVQPQAGGRSPKSQGKTWFEAAATSAAHAIGSQIGRQIIRGVLGSILGGRKK